MCTEPTGRRRHLNRNVHKHTHAHTQALIGALKRKGWEYDVDEGGGAFYGPKIDIKIRDAIGRCVCFVCSLSDRTRQ